MNPTTKAVYGIVLAAALSGCAARASSTPSQESAGNSVYSSSARVLVQPCRDAKGIKAREEVCKLVNAERKEKGLAPLALDSKLTRIAQKHADDMIKRNYFSHTSPDGGTMGNRLERGGAEFGYAGENIAQGQQDAKEVMDSWMNSKPHRVNILDKNYQKLGVGKSGDNWVQVFTD